MNILPCLIFCTSFAACVSSKPGSVAGNDYLDCNYTLYMYLFSQSKNPNPVLYHTYEVLRGLLTKELMPDLTKLMILAVGKLKGCDKPNGLLGSTYLTGGEYLCYCSLYVEKIRWIREALGHGNYSLKDIMASITVLTEIVRYFAIFSGNWYNLVVEKNEKKYPPDMRELFAKIVGSIDSLLQSQWAIMAAYGRIYSGVFQNESHPLYKYVDALRGVMKGYEGKKERLMTGDEFMKCQKMSFEEFISHLKSEHGTFVKNYNRLFYDPDKCLQKELSTIPGTPLVFSDDDDEEKTQIAGEISTGTVQKLKVAGKKPEPGVSVLEEAKDQGAGSSAKAHLAGKRHQDELSKKQTKRSKQKDKKKNKKSKLAADQKPDCTGTKGIEAKVEEAKVEEAKVEEAKVRETKGEIEEHQISKEAAERMLEQDQKKTKTIKQMSKQEKPKTAKQVKEEAKEMFEHTGGMKDDHARKQEVLEEFVELHDKLDKGSKSITYKELRRLLLSPVWSWCMVKGLGGLMKIHPPHDGVDWDSKIDWVILGLCKDKWDTLKGYPSYARVAEAIKKHKMGKENDQK